MAIRPCTKGPKHRWLFIKNVITGRAGGAYVTLSKRGLYKCDCGAWKHDRPRHED